MRYNIEVSCPASNIPELFIIDLTGLELGDSIRFSDIKNISDGVSPTITDRDFIIASVVAPAALTSEEEAEESDEGEEAVEGETTETDTSSNEEKPSEENDKKEE